MKVLKKIGEIASIIIIAILALLAIALAGVRLFGLEPYCVLSGSMEPTYHTGSLIYYDRQCGIENRRNTKRCRRE